MKPSEHLELRRWSLGTQGGHGGSSFQGRELEGKCCTELQGSAGGSL